MYTRKERSTEGVTDGEKLRQQNRPAPDPVNMNPQLRFHPDYQALQASIRKVPRASQIPAPHLLQRSTLVALVWPVQLLVPRGAKADCLEVLSFDWLGFRLCIALCEQSDPKKLR